MSVGNKKILSVIVYYTLAVLALINAGFFIYCLSIKDVAIWAKVIYFVWTGLVIGAIIFDIICTNVCEGKYLSGWIVYVLSILAVGMSMLLYVINSGDAGLSADFFNLFISISALALMTSGYMIATWIVGEKAVEHETAEIEVNE